MLFGGRRTGHEPLDHLHRSDALVQGDQSLGQRHLDAVAAGQLAERSGHHLRAHRGVPRGEGLAGVVVGVARLGLGRDEVADAGQSPERDRVGADGKTVTASALNDYTIDIPMEDFVRYDVLVATHMNGERLQPSDKGPFWIVYPRDGHSDLQDIRYDYRWVWQLIQLKIK